MLELKMNDILLLEKESIPQFVIPFLPGTLQEVRTTDNNRPLDPRSMSSKVIDFCCNQKPIYDFLLVINCHLSSILHSF